MSRLWKRTRAWRGLVTACGWPHGDHSNKGCVEASRLCAAPTPQHGSSLSVQNSLSQGHFPTV